MDGLDDDQGLGNNMNGLNDDLNGVINNDNGIDNGMMDNGIDGSIIEGMDENMAGMMDGMVEGMDDLFGNDWDSKLQPFSRNRTELYLSSFPSLTVPASDDISLSTDNPTVATLEPKTEPDNDTLPDNLTDSMQDQLTAQLPDSMNDAKCDMKSDFKQDPDHKPNILANLRQSIGMSGGMSGMPDKNDQQNNIGQSHNNGEQVSKSQFSVHFPALFRKDYASRGPNNIFSNRLVKFCSNHSRSVSWYQRPPSEKCHHGSGPIVPTWRM